MFFTRTLRQSATKVTTGICGIPVHPNPRPHLIQIYDKTLSALSQLPEHAVYRQATESLTRTRKQVVESTDDVTEIERKLDAGQIEQVIMQAEDELRLVGKMEAWKPWEPLETPAPKGQWEYPGSA